MRENSATLLSITPPPNADAVYDWETNIEDHQPYRTICGADRRVTDHEVTVYTAVTQLADGSIEDNDLAAPGVYVCQGDRDCIPRLNSDQARELAAALLECSAELDRWVQQ